jgi:hypothetical protein
MANFRLRYPKVHGDPPLPPGTRVRCRSTGALGTVEPYACSVGQFPVRWDDPGTGAVWKICLAGDVVPLATMSR